MIFAYLYIKVNLCSRPEHVIISTELWDVTLINLVLSLVKFRHSPVSPAILISFLRNTDIRVTSPWCGSLIIRCSFRLQSRNIWFYDNYEWPITAVVDISNACINIKCRNDFGYLLQICLLWPWGLSVKWFLEGTCQ